LKRNVLPVTFKNIINDGETTTLFYKAFERDHWNLEEISWTRSMENSFTTRNAQADFTRLY
jgi:hypothetical protein